MAFSSYLPILSRETLASISFPFFLIALVFTGIFWLVSSNQKFDSPILGTVQAYAKFAYNCFLKPHTGDGKGSQQDALESFYKSQAEIYDATRVRLLRGREDMLGLVAAQLKERVESGTLPSKPTWVDMGGGTGFNIESMAQFVDVPSFFSVVYLVDLSPSLCRIAEQRFQRLGWKNVKVICQDANLFRIDDYEVDQASPRQFAKDRTYTKKAELITMSYSLSMIPGFYPVVDAISSYLSPNGVIGVADFYVQNQVDYQTKNYIGGEINRHCTFVSRVFWRAWFEQDRVNLEAGRRDYLEYRFGTITTFNARCNMAGFRIPYYVWIGCSKHSSGTQLKLAEVNAVATESPFLAPRDLQGKAAEESQRLKLTPIRSKAYESAVNNLAADLPLPASWYQKHPWRMYYDEQLQKHKQFNNEYIYAFTWEDARVDSRLLKITDEDVIFAITSAGDNILAYAAEGPKRIHAVDLNPSQNHLLELKVASYTALPYEDFWKLFGEGIHPDFRELLVTKLSPHLSSVAFQYWLQHGPRTFSGKGLYFTGGSRHALRLAGWLFKTVGIQGEVKRICQAQTLNEQREIWKRSIRKVLLSRLLSWTIVSNKKWLWRALGVPVHQSDMIERDFLKQAEKHENPVVVATPSEEEQDIVKEATSITDDAQQSSSISESSSTNFAGRAIWSYCVNTLDPVVNETLVADDNHYYLLCLLGHYTQRCHPTYLTERSHAKLSRPDAFDGRISIHTDEICEVLERMAPSTLTIAVVMDSMDWFDPKNNGPAYTQVERLNRALKMGGRVLLRSAGLDPWYVKCFEARGFQAKRVAKREPGTCIDRVNMYASTWILTKVAPLSGESGSGEAAPGLEPLSIGEAAQ